MTTPSISAVDLFRSLELCGPQQQHRARKLLADIAFLRRQANLHISLGNPAGATLLTSVATDLVAEVEHIVLVCPGVPQIPPAPAARAAYSRECAA